MKNLFALFLFALSFVANAIPLPLQTHNVHYEYQDFRDFNTTTEIDVVMDIAPTVGWGTFAKYSIMFRSGTRAEVGLQTDGTTKAVTFTMVDGSSYSKVRPSVSQCSRYETNGTGGICTLPYDWKVGHSYKLRISRIIPSEGDAGFARWGAWVVDNVTGQESLVGAFEVPNLPGGQGYIALYPSQLQPEQRLDGYGDFSYNATYTTVGYNKAPTGFLCQTLATLSVTWSNPTVNKINKPTTATTNYAPSFGPTCGDQASTSTKGMNSVTMGVNATGTTRTPNWSNVWRDYVPTVIPNPAFFGAFPDAGYIGRVKCAFTKIQKELPQYFKGPMAEATGDSWYQLSYSADYARQHGVVQKMYYHHFERVLVVRFPGGEDLKIGTMDDWITMAGC